MENFSAGHHAVIRAGFKTGFTVCLDDLQSQFSLNTKDQFLGPVTTRSSTRVVNAKRELSRRMLKAPPLIPRAYIYRSSKIGLKKGVYNVLKYVQQSSNIKKVDISICPRKKVDKDTLCPINVKS